MTKTVTFDDLPKMVGQETGVSDWLEITQERVNQFADATGDHQWIHLDVERAKKEMPGGKTIAHGYLTLRFARAPSWCRRSSIRNPAACR